MKLVRTFHPVGHGAFYTERFYDEHNQNVANIVFDCGRFEAAKANWSYPLFKTWIEDYVKNRSGLAKNDVIDILFISHFHTDHIIGVDYLLQNYDVKKIVLPVIDVLTVFEALVYTDLTGGDVDVLMKFFENCISDDYKDKIIEVDIRDHSYDEANISNVFPEERTSNTGGRISSEIALIVDSINDTRWKYIPYYRVDASKKSQLEQELQTTFPQITNASDLLQTIKANGVKSFKSMYEKVFGKKHNSYSLTLFSGLLCDKRCFDDCHLKSLRMYSEPEKVTNSQYCDVNCLYMGDYEALNGGLVDLKKFYSSVWTHIGVLQVPHHGSEHNSDKDLYVDKKRFCVISCDSHDKYDHPDPGVLSSIRSSASIPLIVTEQPMTKQELVINLP